MWTDEQRRAASERAKARWADPEYRKKQGNSIKSPLAAQAVVSLTLQNFMWTKKVAELIVFVANAIKNIVKSAGIKEIGLIDGHPEITNMALAKNF